MRNFLFIVMFCLCSFPSYAGTQFGEGSEVFLASNHGTVLLAMKYLARGGNSEAQYIVGSSYAEGDGVSRDYKEALKWYRLSAKQGHTNAQNNLGVLYYEGKGVSRSKKNAKKWWKKAAKGGSVEAQKNLKLLDGQGGGISFVKEAGQIAKRLILRRILKRK